MDIEVLNSSGELVEHTHAGTIPLPDFPHPTLTPRVRWVSITYATYEGHVVQWCHVPKYEIMPEDATTGNPLGPGCVLRCDDGVYRVLSLLRGKLEEI